MISLIIDLGQAADGLLYVELEDETRYFATNPEFENELFFDLIEEEIEIDGDKFKDALGTVIGVIDNNIIKWSEEYLDGLRSL